MDIDFLFIKSFDQFWLTLFFVTPTSKFFKRRLLRISYVFCSYTTNFYLKLSQYIHSDLKG